MALVMNDTASSSHGPVTRIDESLFHRTTDGKERVREEGAEQLDDAVGGFHPRELERDGEGVDHVSGLLIGLELQRDVESPPRVGG